MNGTVIAIGIIYTSMGAFGILENGMTAYLMATDPQMRNPTYFYMINLSIADAVILIPIAFYAGLSLLWPVLAHPIAIRIGAFLAGAGWYPGCLFMVFASITRYFQLAKPEKVPVYFTRRFLIVSISLAWIIPSGLYTWLIYWPSTLFNFMTERYTWGFNRDVPFGYALSVVNITVNSIFAICINIFNALSLMCVRNIRKQVQTIDTGDHGNLKREIKLFAQCAITGTIYTAAVIYFFAVSAVEDSLVWYEFLITHLLWTCNHLQNPIIYFILNTRLRRRVIRILCPYKAAQVHASTTGGAALSRRASRAPSVRQG